MDADQTNRRAEAWELGLQRRYDDALRILDGLLRTVPNDLPTLRMKGNLLELKAMDLLENSSKRLTSSADYMTARQCYEAILRIDKQNVRVLIDLGDHYRTLDAKDKAIEYYRGAANALQKAPTESSRKEDVEELLESVALLTKYDRVAEEARSIEVWCIEQLRASE